MGEADLQRPVPGAGTGPDAEAHGLAASRLGALRERVRARRGGRLAWRFGITVAGVAVIGVGIVLLPLPGPGWLIIFGGLGLLATEYEWAARLLHLARLQVGRWTAWAGRQNRFVQALLALAGLVLLAALALAGWWVSLR